MFIKASEMDVATGMRMNIEELQEMARQPASRRLGAICLCVSFAPCSKLAFNRAGVEVLQAHE